MPTIDPDNPLIEVPTRAEREAAYPRILKAKGALAHTDIVKQFDAERDAERRSAIVRDACADSTAPAHQATQLVDL
ncbi:MAG: hypothetical protein F4Z02_00020 [Acidimicrobiia bacterium]|nr:hypothetical protein [Acidimicrobiia bacterium]